MAAALDYHEPGIISILILSSFLLALNISNYLFDRLLSCGLVAQIFVGIAFGTPGGKLLDERSEALITPLGYIGLILLVFEGGLETSIISLRRNIGIACLVAIVGIVFPIAISFSLVPINNATYLQSFAAGAALCSTSLGTTFTVLQSNNLVETRLGSILTSAAMLDDVVGLIMVQVISNLRGEFQIASVIRPLGVSIAFIILSVVICLILKFFTKLLLKSEAGIWLYNYSFSAFLSQTLFLLAMITAASYAGTSNLFAAYLTGVCLSWWYGWSAEMRMLMQTGSAGSSNPADAGSKRNSKELTSSSSNTDRRHDVSSVTTYRQCYGPISQSILKPLFFASIGFAIPITEMFEGQIIWRGLVYAILMCVAKMTTGLCLIRFGPWARIGALLSHWTSQPKISNARAISETAEGSTLPNNDDRGDERDHGLSRQRAVEETMNLTQGKSTVSPSLYTAAALGMAMVARGEIGFLIAATAQSSGIFEQDGSQALYLTVIWAITLCTMIGPVVMGLIVRRLKRYDMAAIGL